MDSSWSPALFAQISFRRENTPERTERGSVLEAVPSASDWSQHRSMCQFCSQSALSGRANSALLLQQALRKPSTLPQAPRLAPREAERVCFHQNLITYLWRQKYKKTSESYNQYLPSSLFRIIWKYRLVSNEDPSVPKTLSSLSRGFHFDGETRNASASLEAIFGEGQMYN